MVEYNDFHNVQGELKKEFGNDVASVIFSFLYVFIKNWHTDPLRLYFKTPDVNNGKHPSVQAWKAYKVSFTTTEQLYRMRKMGHALTLYHPCLFYMPYSQWFETWEIQLGTERAKELVAYYSYNPDFVQYGARLSTCNRPCYGPNFHGWTPEGNSWAEKAFIEHLEDVVLDVELTKEEKRVTPSVTIWASDTDKYLQRNRKRKHNRLK